MKYIVVEQDATESGDVSYLDTAVMCGSMDAAYKAVDKKMNVLESSINDDTPMFVSIFESKGKKLSLIKAYAVGI